MTSIGVLIVAHCQLEKFKTVQLVLEKPSEGSLVLLLGMGLSKLDILSNV